MDYEKMLERGLSKIPKRSKKSERFEIPKTIIQRQGARTEISNFYDIARTLRRDPEHLLKFILKELATSCDLKDGKRIVVLGNFSAELIDKKIELYFNTFVKCPECGKPDTKLVREDRLYFLVCEACGARHSEGR